MKLSLVEPNLENWLGGGSQRFSEGLLSKQSMRWERSKGGSRAKV